MDISKLQKIQELINKGYFEDALNLIDEINIVQDSLEGIVTYNMKIAALIGLARYNEALKIANELMQMIEKYEKRELDIINTYKVLAIDNLYRIYSIIGEHEKALNILYEKIKYPKFDHLEEVYEKIDLAMEYSNLGDFSKSIDILQEELSKTQDKISKIELLLALGDIYRFFIQDLNKSREFYYKAYNLATDSENEIRIKVFKRYVDLLSEMGEREDANDYLNELLNSTVSELERAEVLEKLAFVNKENTKSYLIEALQIYRKLGIRYKEATILYELSNIEETIEKSIELLKEAISNVESIAMKQFSFMYKNALAYKLFLAKKFDEAKSILINLIEEKEISNFLLAYCYVGLATIDKYEGRYSGAVNWLNKAEQLLDQMRHALSMENRIQFSNTYATVKREAVRMLLDSDIKQAIKKAEEAKAKSLIESVSLSKIPKPSNEEIFDQEEKLIEDLNAAMKNNSPYIKEIYKKLEAIWSLLENKSKYEEYLTLRRGNVIDPNEIFNLIDKDTAIINYLILTDQLLVFIISKNNLEVIKILKNKSSIYNLFEKFKEFEKFKDIYINEKLIKEASDVLISPIEEKIKIYKHLCISPDLVLYYTPFHALYFKGKELIESKIISYIPNLTLLKYCKKRESKGDYLIIGGSPNNDLKYAPQESKEIADLFKTEVKNYSKKEIIEKMKSSKVISFSCHANYSSRDYGLASYILLPNGEYLTAKEILRTRLSAELVTLSACETAKLSYFEGGDILGLLGSFLYAGAKSVVASLWKLNDHAGYLAMKEFYFRLVQGINKAEALRLALLVTKKEYPNPYHWSPLILVGEYSSVLNTYREGP
jgi:CHAT domain-containing protein/flagellar biosynthesis regulator FlbT